METKYTKKELEEIAQRGEELKAKIRALENEVLEYSKEVISNYSSPDGFSKPDFLTLLPTFSTEILLGMIINGAKNRIYMKDYKEE